MSDENRGREFGRREILKMGALAGMATALGGLKAFGSSMPASVSTSAFGIPIAKPMQTVRIGFVGTGGRGTGLVNQLLKCKGVEIKAICDIVEANAMRAHDMVVKAGQPKPKLYTRGDHDFERLCAEEELDLVFTATPWDWHVPVCMAAMQNGKHAATEVPAAVTLEDCWKLVEMSQKTGLYCIMPENCCYDRLEMMALVMARKNLLGELVHAECGYLHDLRVQKLSGKREGPWRLPHTIRRNGDLYPTHGLGPVAQCMNINRGNRIVRLVSMASKSRGLNAYAAEKFGPDSPQAKQKYALGDVVTTLLETENGETITITHNTDSPRPYSRDILLQGTKGILRKYPEEKIHIEGRTKGHLWEPLDSYRAEFEHPLWGNLQSESQPVNMEESGTTGHGSMDYLVVYRLIRALQTGTEPDMDVYDAAAWSAVSELSERSIAKKSQPQEFPDFTRGNWNKRSPLGIIEA